MNWRSLLLTVFISIVYKFVSASATATNKPDAKDSILMAVVYNLPNSCKAYTATGTFNSGSESSYDCLFDNVTFDINKASIIMSLLMQGGREKLVQEIAKKWVNGRKWGPFNQAEIAAELMAVLSVKTSVRSGENKKMKIELKVQSIYETFKTLLKAGNESIVANELYSNVAAKAFNLAFKVDKGEKDYAATTSIILDHFYSINDKISSNIDIVKMAQAGFAVSSLNNLAGKKKINAEAWEVYGPSICKQLNSIYGTDFAMVEKAVINEKTKSKKKDYDSSSSSSESESDSDSDSDSDSLNENASEGVKTESSASVKPKPIKFIDLKSKFGSKVVVTAPASSKNAFEFGNGFWFIIGGSSILILSLAYAAYQFVLKRRRESSELSDL